MLAGGLGSRLRPYTTIIPKPLMPLGERPILEILLRQLAHQGFTQVDLCVGYLAHLIRAFFGDGSAFGIHIEYHEEREPLGTIGALAVIPDFSPDEPILVMNGDILTDLDFSDVVARHVVPGDCESPPTVTQVGASVSMHVPSPMQQGLGQSVASVRGVPFDQAPGLLSVTLSFPVTR